MGACLSVEDFDEMKPPVYHDRRVFAHYMVGLTNGQSKEQWARDIHAAKQAGIDGFALNIGPSDPWTEEQVNLAYQVAEWARDFSLFLSFDMAAGEWAVQKVSYLINQFRGSDAQMVVDGKPMVSTFEGPEWAENWIIVREQTNDIFLIPDWSSLGPHGIAEKLGLIDGAFSWNAWPKAGENLMTTEEDELYKEALGGKKYMMPVSPYFYTNLPEWDKNWYSSSESLWYDRWQQVLEVMPDYVQIITWNDFGESSYICDPSPEASDVPGRRYVEGYSHDAYRALLPYFIAAYKAGTWDIDLQGSEMAVAWYRRTPARVGEHGGTKWGQSGEELAMNGARDVISVVALTCESVPVTVIIGAKEETVWTKPGRGVSYFEIPFDRRTIGPVEISLNGQTSEGPPIMCECDGQTNFNATVIKV